MIVVGLHGLGLRVVEQLHRLGQQVTVVDDDADTRSISQIDSWGVPHLVGDGARPDVLTRAGIDRADAVICLESSDLHSLQIALTVHDLNPAARVLVRSAHVSVGTAIETAIPSGTVLDAAALAAPAFVDAIAKRPLHEVRVGDQEFRIVECRAPAAGTLRDVFGALVPIVVQGRNGTDTCPGRDTVVATGDQLALLGTDEQLVAAGLLAAEADHPHAPIGARFSAHGNPDSGSSGSFRSMWRYIFFGADRALKTTVVAFLVLTILATVLIDIGYVTTGGPGMDAVDALYTTVQTLVTVGYGDFPFGDQPTWLRVFDIVLMIVGAALVAILFAQLTDLLVSRRIASTYGSQRAGTMRGHVLVVGLGGVGLHVVELLLSQGRRVAVIDRDPSPRRLAAARRLDVPVVVGDATDPQVLAAANLSVAGGVVVATSDDLANVDTGLAVREELGATADAVPMVLRLFDRALSVTVQRALGFREVRSTAALAAPWFVAAALGLEVVSCPTVGGVALMVGSVEVAGSGSLTGTTLADLGAGVRVLSIGDAHTPRRDAVLQAGDRVSMIGPPDEILAILIRNRAA